MSCFFFWHFFHFTTSLIIDHSINDAHPTHAFNYHDDVTGHFLVTACACTSSMNRQLITIISCNAATFGCELQEDFYQNVQMVWYKLSVMGIIKCHKGAMLLIPFTLKFHIPLRIVTEINMIAYHGKGNLPKISNWDLFL